MMSLKVVSTLVTPLRRHFATTNLNWSAANSKDFQLVVVGGGAGGCTMAAKFSRKLGAGKVAIIEPSETHYYQPLWTLVGGGIKDFSSSSKAMKNVLPSNATWIKDKAIAFDPANNKLTTANGTQINYQFLIVSAGIQLDYNLVKGLNNALETTGVCSNYSPTYVKNTYPAIQNLMKEDGGNAIFTFPNTPIKCAGAPQKIMYLTEDLLQKSGKRSGREVIYVTSTPGMFGVKKYADALEIIRNKRNIRVYFRHHLIEVKPDSKEAVFQNIDKPESTITLPYRMLHVTPPMSSPDMLKKSPLADAVGWVDVNKETLQHNKFPNVFSLGDCSNVPTSKTAAAVAAQSGILYRNLSSLMDQSKLGKSKYDGYTSCPLVTAKGKCILAEFDFNGTPLETLPIDQSVERLTSYIMKKDLMPFLYWNLMLRGWWEGPRIVRKIAHLGMGK